ncbi:hypothetical protein CHLRE_06g303350v5 [Chlamydomonas reinhardtii]|uniref:Uncharacterized protein n=1 Tax=Chlamydomonas reinhardtii TaxID=3055 RepID=A8INE1_CHLRE|nr:uncharacterized protein CHLRE_06g303350v5 [Chlamydomonas reinhardtii]PNW83020.1 hypothetical protein CHLRE_06g303350v5 [Chlamydomonas reinhardtii]|eukprot:XP_001691259.1 predicted protein [Chlamydomonas reinhardtii]
MAGCCSCNSRTKCFVWVLWLVNLLVSAVYLGISLTTFYNVQHGYKFVVNADRPYKDSSLGACMMGFLMVLFWVIFSFFILIGRLFSAMPLGYGLMLGSCSHTGLFMILAGLVLQTHYSLAEAFQKSGIWSTADLQTYTATYVFNYVLAGTYLIMFIVLLLTKGDMQAGEARGEAYVAKPAPAVPSAMGGTATSGTAPTQVQMPTYDNHGFGTNWPNQYRGGNV